MSARARSPNHPAAGKAGIASMFTIRQHCPSLPAPGCSVAAREHSAICTVKQA
jgi:hypothetical protein